MLGAEPAAQLRHVGAHTLGAGLGSVPIVARQRDLQLLGRRPLAAGGAAR